jgi:hypothetical protein
LTFPLKYDIIEARHIVSSFRKDVMGRTSDYTWEQKVLAGERILATQNISEVAREIDIPYATLQYWRGEPWWQKVVEEVRAKERAKRNKKLNAIVELSLETVEDRLLNGEKVLNNKTGQLVSKPVSLRDATNVASTIISEQTRMEALDRTMTVEQEAVVDTLKMLAAEFAKFNRKSKAVDNAIYDEREEGLQEGSGSLHQQALGNP